MLFFTSFQSRNLVLLASLLPFCPYAYAQLPEAPGKEVLTRVCATCHPAEIVLGRGMSREQWGSIVSNMVSRGAKGSDEEFATILDYLAKNLPPGTKPAAAAAASSTKKRGGGGGLLAQAGAADKHITDEEAAGRGKSIYVAQCVTCHGARGRGTQSGPDLVRSLVVLKDRYGSTVGPFLKKGHPMQGGIASASLTAEQVEDLSHFLHQKVDDTLRTGPYNTVLNVLTGDPKAGEAYFNGDGGCAGCHSATGDLAGIAKKYEPPVLQLKMVFPQTVAFGRGPSKGPKKPVTVTVTPEGKPAISGTLVQMDDFNVSLRTADGEFMTVERTPNVRVEKNDPYAAHVALLDRYTDKDIHNLVAYLETLK